MTPDFDLVPWGVGYMLVSLFTGIFYLWTKAHRKRATLEALDHFTKQILAGVLLGVVDVYKICGTRLTLYGRIGWIDMVDSYQKYISALPLHTRHEIIDKIIQNQVVRLKDECTNLETIVSKLSYIEIETLQFAINEKHTEYDEFGRPLGLLQYSYGDLTNDIIAFQLRNPY